MSLRSNMARCAALTVISLCAAGSYAQKSFTFPFLAEFENAGACIGWNATGGQPGAYYELSPDGVLTVSSAFQPVETLWSMGDCKPVLSWIAATLPSPKVVYMNIKMYSAAREATTKASHSMILTSGEFPGGDIELKEPRGLEIAAKPIEIRQLMAHEAAHTVQQAAKKQKAWMCSNFRLRLGDLPTGNVVRTEKIKFKQEFGPTQAVKKTALGIEGTPEAEVGYRVEDFAFEIPSSDRAAYDQHMVKALDGNPSLLVMEMDYLDTDGMPLVTVRMRVRLVSIGQTKMTADQQDPNQLLRVVVEPVDRSPTTGSLEIIIK